MILPSSPCVTDSCYATVRHMDKSPPSTVGRAQGPSPCGRELEPHGGCCLIDTCDVLWRCTGMHIAPSPTDTQIYGMHNIQHTKMLTLSAFDFEQKKNKKHVCNVHVSSVVDSCPHSDIAMIFLSSPCVSESCFGAAWNLRLAQSAERKALNLVVVGSSPSVGAA